MRIYSLLALLALCIAQVGCDLDTAPMSTAPLRKQTIPIWKPEVELADRLLKWPTYYDAGFSMRLPSDFSQINERPIGLSCEPRQDGTRPSITISREDDRGKMLIPSGILKNSIKSIQRRRVNYQESPIETGMIGSLKFARLSWTGDEFQTRIPTKGTMYCTIVGKFRVTISVLDVAGHDDGKFELAEASVLTFESTQEKEQATH